MARQVTPGLHPHSSASRYSVLDALSVPALNQVAENVTLDQTHLVVGLGHSFAVVRRSQIWIPVELAWLELAKLPGRATRLIL